MSVNTDLEDLVEIANQMFAKVPPEARPGPNSERRILTMSPEDRIFEVTGNPLVLGADPELFLCVDVGPGGVPSRDEVRWWRRRQAPRRGRRP